MMKRSSERSRVRGFTLVEVLVALVIVAIGMAALLSTLTSSADTTVYLRDKTFAQWIALNRIAEVRLQRQRSREGKQNGEVEFASRRWIWMQEVQEAEVEGVMRIDVMVRPADVAKGDGAWYAVVSGVLGSSGGGGGALALPGSVPLQWEPSSSAGPNGGGDDEEDQNGGTGPPPEEPPSEETIFQ